MWSRLRDILAGVTCIVLATGYFVLLRLVNIDRRYARMRDPFAAPGRAGVIYGMRVMAPARLLPKHVRAITFGKYVFCKHRDPGPALLRHEFTHSVQYRFYGWFRFLYRYGVEIARSGYAGSQIEQQARANERL